MVGNDMLDSFFKPSSIAVVGASRRKGKIGYEILASLISSGYKGKVYPVNPTADMILGLKCYKTISDIDEDVEMAVIAIRASHVPMVMEECGRKGVKAVVIISGGFKELGGEGEKYEKQIGEICGKYGMRAIGPNCIGILCPETGVDTLFHSRERCLRPKPGDVAFIAQSGTFALTIVEWLAEAGIGMSKMISYGNMVDVTESELIEYLAEDEKTRIILAYIESVRDGRRFYNTLRKTTGRKPVLLLKSGRTEEGVKAAKSHTGGLAGSYMIFKAAALQAGAVLVEDIRDLFNTAKALEWQPLPKGNRLVMVTNGAGPAVMAIDKMRDLTIKPGKPSRETVMKLRDKYPPAYIIDKNPIDLTGSATSRDYRLAIEALIEDDSVDIVMPIFVFQDTPLDKGIVDVLAEYNWRGKPIICCAAGGPYSRMMSKELEKQGIPVYTTPEEAVKVADYMYRCSRALSTQD